jgi:hypothetical protein
LFFKNITSLLFIVYCTGRCGLHLILFCSNQILATTNYLQVSLEGGATFTSEGFLDSADAAYESAAKNAVLSLKTAGGGGFGRPAKVVVT